MATLFVSKENLIKTEGDMGEDKPFPIVSLRDLVVAKATKVFIEFPWKAYVFDATPEACCRWEMIVISLQTVEIQLVKCVDGQRMDHYQPTIL